VQQIKKLVLVILLVIMATIFAGCIETFEELLNDEDYQDQSIGALKRTEYFRSGAIAHILEGELNRSGKAVGFHYDKLPSKKGKVIEGTKTEENEHGVYEAEVKVEGVKKESNQGRSTFFPDDWSAQKVIDAINEAYESREFLTGNTYEGLSEEGLPIRMYLDDNEQIITAFPLY